MQSLVKCDSRQCSWPQFSRSITALVNPVVSFFCRRSQLLEKLGNLLAVGGTSYALFFLFSLE